MTGRWPNNTHRMLIAGRTGTGKTVFGVHALSQAPFDKQPYIIIDYKGDSLINAIDRARYIDDAKWTIPREPGVYILPAIPTIDDEKMERFLWRVHARENVGLFLDEGYMIPARSPPMQAIYTQGRSKRIPVITLTQRPFWLSRFAFSESDFYVYFPLNDLDDRKRFREFVPGNTSVWDLEQRLPDFHARYYDQAKNSSLTLLPSPAPEQILDVFNSRLKKRTRMI